MQGEASARLEGLPSVAREGRLLLLTTDAYGAPGGLGKYNRDFISAVCLHRSVRELEVIPRTGTTANPSVSDKLTYVADGVGSKRRFIATVARRNVVSRGYSAVLCGHVNLLPVAVATAWRHRAPLLLLVYGIDVWQPPRNLVTHRACGQVDGVVSISQVTVDRFRAWAPLEGKPTWVLPNAIDLERFGAGPPSPALKARYGLGDKVIATLARLDAHERMKGIDEVLEVMPRLLERHPDLKYLVMGDGSDKARLVDKSRALGLSNHAVFAGRIDEAEKADHYRLADAFVMPSRGEGFGFVFLEALACGIPVVASRIDGGREAIRDGLLGELVNPDEPEDIVRGVTAALAKRRGIVPDGLRYFAFENFTSRVHAFVDEIMSRPVARWREGH